MSGVGLVIGLAQIIALLDVFLQIHLGVFVLIHLLGALHAVNDIGMKEYVKARDSRFTQNDVGAAADDDAVLLCKIQNRCLLRKKDAVMRAGIGDGVVQEVIHELSGMAHVLALFLDVFHGIAALLRGFLHKVAVIERNAEPVGDALCNRASSGAIFAADGNNRIFLV